MTNNENAHPDIVVIGASAAGLRAAARAKRLMPKSNVTVVDREKIISYGACGLPYYLAGDIESPRPLRATQWGTIRDEEFFLRVKALKVLTETRADRIDPETHTVHITDLKSNQTRKLHFDKLVLATGASPILLDGIDKGHERISVFKTLEDAKLWRTKLERNEMDRVAIIGAGFIGIELAEAFASLWGCKVDLVESEDRVLPQMLDSEMARLVQAHLESQGVRVHTGHCVNAIRDTGEGLEIVCEKNTIPTQYAIMGLGVSPNVDLAKQAGIVVGDRGGIVVDELMQTNLPDVYAAGDCVEVELVCGAKAVIPLGSLANKQGRAVGDNLAGRGTKVGKVVGSAGVKAFDLNVAATGLTERMAQRIGLETKAIWGTFGDRAHYHPDDKTMALKLLYQPGTQLLLGLQAVGAGEVVKRVDVFGNLVLAGGRLDDLLDLEFCYSPPYAPALDPLYTIGAAALNQEDGITAVAPDDPLEGVSVVDVRTEDEFAGGSADRAVNIPLEQFRERLGEVDSSKPVTVICARGARSAEAARILMQNGYANVNYVGGGVSMRKK